MNRRPQEREAVLQLCDKIINGVRGGLPSNSPEIQGMLWRLGNLTKPHIAAIERRKEFRVSVHDAANRAAYAYAARRQE